jgi:hypothetical protein
MATATGMASSSGRRRWSSVKVVRFKVTDRKKSQQLIGGEQGDARRNSDIDHAGERVFVPDTEQNLEYSQKLTKRLILYEPSAPYYCVHYRVMRLSYATHNPAFL